MLKEFKKAFTLAEVLIVIGIIGVVAALTLPNLNHATGDKETVTRVKKIYSILNDAFGRAEAVYGNVDGWFTDLPGDENFEQRTQYFGERISSFMKVSKIDSELAYSDWNKYILSDGTGIGFFMQYDSPKISKYYDNAKILGYITVDIDGPNKGKNQLGVDQFSFEITTQGIYPQGIDENNLVSQCFGTGYCTRWVIDNDNVDYLKADENGVCPNGVQLSWTQTSCN